MACLIRKPPSRIAGIGADYSLVSSAFAGQTKSLSGQNGAEQSSGARGAGGRRFGGAGAGDVQRVWRWAMVFGVVIVMGFDKVDGCGDRGDDLGRQVGW